MNTARYLQSLVEQFCEAYYSKVNAATIFQEYIGFASRFNVVYDQLVIHGDHVLGGTGIISRLLYTLRPIRR